METSSTIRKAQRLLAAEMYGCILVSAAIVALYETETLMPGCLVGDANAEFITVSAMEILTICLMPL